MKASIIIPTYNGALKIGALLDVLAAQTFKDFEVIVVIDGSTDQTHALVTGHTSRFQNLKIINQENKGRAGSRNAGALAASGDVLIFLDDDIEPINDVIQLHMKHHQSIQVSIVVGRLFMDVRESNNDFFNYRISIEKKWNAGFPDELKTVTFENYRFTSANLSLKKEVFISLNGFDKRLKDSEDFDFSLRALLKKIPIHYDKSILAWHRDFTDLAGYIARMKEYKHSKSYLLTLHPEYLKMHPQSFAINQKPLSLIKLLISKLFTFNSFWKILLNSKLFLNLVPKKIRFRCYELVIYSTTLND